MSEALKKFLECYKAWELAAREETVSFDELQELWKAHWQARDAYLGLGPEQKFFADPDPIRSRFRVN